MANIQRKVSKSGDISYRLRCCVGRDNLNNQVWRTATIPSPKLTPAKEQKEVERLAAEWEEKTKAEYKAAPEKQEKKKAVTFAEYVDDHWLPVSVMDGEHTPDTVQFYKSMSEALKRRFGKAALTAITKEEIKRYVVYMRTTEKQKNGKPLSASTVKHRFAVLRIIFNDAESLGYLKMEENPFRRMTLKDRPKGENKDVDWMNDEQEKALVEALEAAPQKWRVLITLLLRTGLRRGEAVGLQWQDVDFENNRLSIQRNVTPDADAEEKYNIGLPKGNKTRTIPITAEMAAMLKDWQTEQASRYDCIALNKAFIFSSDADLFRPMFPSTPTLWLRTFEKKNGLADFSPHDLRHTFATKAQQRGADIRSVAAVLGHSSSDMTFTHYTGTDENAMRAAVEAVQNIAG